MKVVGLITEYNPFHNGHEYHIKEAKRITGADYVVVVMSGNFVQRGAPAITDKYTRTKMALSCGADLVIELPTFYATASAEYFAFGSVQLLDSLGFIDFICFGSECGDITLLDSIATLLKDEPVLYKELLTAKLKQGLTFPLARKEALTAYLHDNITEISTPLYKLEELLASPNNILGIEYIKALKTLSSKIQPITIKRIVNNYHDTSLSHSISSASAIRAAFASEILNKAIQSTIPTNAYPYFEENYMRTLPIFENDFSSMLYYKLLHETEENLATYLDVTTELAKRMKNYLPQYLSYTQFVDLVKSKNITQTRVQRMLLHILLGIKQDIFQVDKVKTPNYIRILGIKRSATSLLKKSTINNLLPIITKVADAKQVLSPEQWKLFQLDLNSSHLYNQVVYQKYTTIIPDEYRYGVIFF